MDERSPIHPAPAGRRFGPGALVVTLLAGLALGGGAVLLARAPGAGRGEGQAPAAAGASGAAHAHAEEAHGTRYVCPMHPTVVSDHPGDCPICGMKLVKVESPAAPPGGGAPSRPGGEAEAPAGRTIAFYRSPMDPRVTSPTPRKDEMGMDFVPVYRDEVGGEGRAGAVEGLATVRIDPQRQQLIGLRTAEVTRGPVGATWRTVGKVAVDETRVHHVNIKVAGFAEHVHADYIGMRVRRGEPLFTIYSPDLLSAQREYLLALRTRSALAGAGAGADGGDELVAAARERLRLWDIPPSEIERLERTGTPTRTLTILSPATGVITKKDVVMGHRLNEGDMPYEITDLSRVWVLADAYESDLARVRLGMAATLTLPAFPDRSYRGRVIFVDPILDAKTRTAKVRLEFANPAGDLRPEMYGEITLHAPPRQGLRIPADAVIDSGTRRVVFVALPEGRFQPREVRLGAAGGDTVEVLAGVEAGERVVTRANFLIDSESSLRASLAAMGGKQP